MKKIVFLILLCLLLLGSAFMYMEYTKKLSVSAVGKGIEKNKNVEIQLKTEDNYICSTINLPDELVNGQSMDVVCKNKTFPLIEKQLQVSIQGLMTTNLPDMKTLKEDIFSSVGSKITTENHVEDRSSAVLYRITDELGIELLVFYKMKDQSYNAYFWGHIYNDGNHLVWYNEEDNSFSNKLDYGGKMTGIRTELYEEAIQSHVEVGFKRLY